MSEKGFLIRERTDENIVRKISRVLYYITVALYCLGYFITILNWNITHPGMGELGGKLLDIARVILLALLLEQFNVSLSRGLVSLLIITISVAYYFYSGGWGPIDLLLVFALSDNADEEGMKKMLLLLYLCFIIMFVWLGVSGDIKDVVKEFSYSRGRSLGFGYPNTLGAIVFTLVVLLRLTVLRKNNWLFAVACAGAIAFSWFYAKSRTIVVLLAVYPIMDILLACCKKGKHSGIIRVFRFLPTILALFSVLMTLYIAQANPEWQNNWNSMLRFSFPAVYIREQGLSLLGGAKLGYDSLPIDNAYVFVILKHGIIWEIILVAYLTMMMQCLVRRNRVEYVVAFAMFLFQGVMESTMLIPLFNVIPIFALSIREKAAEPEKTVKTDQKWRISLIIITAIACLTGMFIIRDPTLSDTYYESNPYSYSSPTAVVSKDTVLSQSITVKSMQAVRMNMVTYGTQPQGKYRFTLFDENRNALESTEIPGSRIHDWEMLEIRFQKEYPGGKYILQLESADTEGESVAILQNDANPYPDGEAYINGIPTESDWIFEYAYQVEDNTWLYRGILFVLWMILLGFIWFV